MTLPPFDLHRARSLDEAHELLERYGEDAAVVCGGTELLLLLKLGFAAYGHLVDVKGIEELGGIRAENGTLVIGATATHREIERSSLVLERLPALAAMERDVANIRVRNVGTLGGNLCFSDPHSDPATFLLALDAEVDYDGGRMAALRNSWSAPTRPPSRRGSSCDRCASRSPIPGRGIAHRKLSFHERPAATVAAAVRAERRNGRRRAHRSWVGRRSARPGDGRRRSPHREAGHRHSRARRGGGARRGGLGRRRGRKRLGRVQTAARSRPGRAMRDCCTGQHRRPVSRGCR